MRPDPAFAGGVAAAQRDVGWLDFTIPTGTITLLAAAHTNGIHQLGESRMHHQTVLDAHHIV
jgi:hypothetical protein